MLIIIVTIATLALCTSLIAVYADAGTGKVHFEYDYTVTEGYEHPFYVYVVRDQGGSGPLSVNYYTTDGTGAAGYNYDTASGTIAWAAGEYGRKPILLNIRQDPAHGRVRDFHVHLAGDNPSGNIVWPQSATVFSVNYDNPIPKDQDYVHIHDPIVVYTNESYVTIIVDRNIDEAVGTHEPPKLAGESIVFIRTTFGGTARTDVDYIPASRLFFWGDGAGGPQTFLIPLIHNSIPDEADKTINVEMGYDYGSSPTAIIHTTYGGGLVIATPEVYESPRYITVTLKEDLRGSSTPAPSSGVIGLVDSALSVNEGGVYEIYVERTGGSAGNVRMGVYTTDRTARAGQDYTSFSQEFEFPAGVEGPASRKYIRIPITADGVPEDGEVFTINLFKVSGDNIELGLRGLDIMINDVPAGASPSVTPVPTPTPADTPTYYPSPEPDRAGSGGLPCCCPMMIVLPLILVGSFGIKRLYGKK